MSTNTSFGTLVETIKRQYELPEILAIEAIPSPRSNTADQEAVYKIFTSNNSYVLRRYRTDSMDAIVSHNRFLAWAERNGYLLSQRIIRTRADADTFSHQNHMWWLARYVEADQSYQWTVPEWNAEVCFEAGRALYELHLLLQEFGKEIQSAQLNFWSNEPSVVSYVETKLMAALSATQMFAAEAPTLQKLLQNALKLIQTDSASATEYPRKAQLVHGDFHPGNLLLKNGKAITIIDFEYLHFEEVTYDLAYALIMFCAKWSQEHDGMLDPALVQSFLSGYAQSALAIDPEILDAYMIVAASVNLAWLLERPSDRAKAKHFVNLLNHLQNFSTISLSVSTERSAF